MAVHKLSAQFQKFFKNLNPSPTWRAQASSQYTSIKSVLEGSPHLAALQPYCFLQGSFDRETAIHTINDLDIVLLAQGVGYPVPAGQGGGDGWPRDRIFAAVEASLRADGSYASKLVPTKPTSMCVKLDMGIKVEILPVVRQWGESDSAVEPFWLWRPATSNWEKGYARYHQAHLSAKNQGHPPHTGTDGNFIPMIKVLKHLRKIHNVDSVSFHIECLLYNLPDRIFRGSPAVFIPAVLGALAAGKPDDWYMLTMKSPCQDRDIFTSAEWTKENWAAFHDALVTWATVASMAASEDDWSKAVSYWKVLLGDQFFPAHVGQ